MLSKTSSIPKFCIKAEFSAISLQYLCIFKKYLAKNTEIKIISTVQTINPMEIIHSVCSLSESVRFKICLTPPSNAIFAL